MGVRKLLNPPEAREVPERTRRPACVSCGGVQPAVFFPLEPVLQEAPRRQPLSQTSSGLEVGREMGWCPALGHCVPAPLPRRPDPLRETGTRS